MRYARLIACLALGAVAILSSGAENVHADTCTAECKSDRKACMVGAREEFRAAKADCVATEDTCVAICGGLCSEACCPPPNFCIPPDRLGSPECRDCILRGQCPPAPCSP